MLESEGIVRSLSERECWVETALSAHCGSCSTHCYAEGSRRGTTLMVSVPGSMELSPGDRVLLGLPEAPLLGAAARLYLFPLISFFAGALLGAGLAEQWNWPSADLAAAGGGILAAMIHFRRLQRSLASQVAACRPVILRRL